MSEFKMGNRVKVVKDFVLDGIAPDFPAQSLWLGREGVVDSVNHDGGFVYVLLDEDVDTLPFKPEELEVIE